MPRCIYCAKSFDLRGYAAHEAACSKLAYPGQALIMRIFWASLKVVLVLIACGIVSSIGLAIVVKTTTTGLGAVYYAAYYFCETNFNFTLLEALPSP